MSRLISKLAKTGIVGGTVLAEENTKQDVEYPTKIPALNIALSGRMDGGYIPGIITIAGQSKNFKTLFGLIMVEAYLRAHKDAVCVFYDSEFGAAASYFDAIGIDKGRVIHIPVGTVEDLKIDMTKKLDEIKDGEHVIFFLDSLGNLASKKEVDDAMNEKYAADMTRARAIKSLFRIIMHPIGTKGIPFVVVNHIYETQDIFSQKKLSGGTGIMYASNDILMVSRKQIKEQGKVSGYEFIITIEKSRRVKEKEKIAIEVKHEDGINPYSGLLELAIEFGYVIKSGTRYYRKDISGDKAVFKKDTQNFEWFSPFIGNLAKDIERKYALIKEDANIMIGDDVVNSLTKIKKEA